MKIGKSLFNKKQYVKIILKILQNLDHVLDHLLDHVIKHVTIKYKQVDQNFVGEF